VRLPGSHVDGDRAAGDGVGWLEGHRLISPADFIINGVLVEGLDGPILVVASGSPTVPEVGERFLVRYRAHEVPNGRKAKDSFSPIPSIAAGIEEVVQGASHPPLNSVTVGSAIVPGMYF
jgi:hypothetical protein